MKNTLPNTSDIAAAYAYFTAMPHSDDIWKFQDTYKRARDDFYRWLEAVKAGAPE